MRVIRGEQGFSQEELGRRAGLHRAHVGQIERGEVSPTLDSVQLIAMALNVEPARLIVLAQAKVAPLDGAPSTT